MELSAKKVAHVIAEKYLSLEIEDISQMKLHKLVFFAWAWYGVLYGKKLFKEEPKAYKHGPVFSSLRKGGLPKYNIPLLQEDLQYTASDIEDKNVLEHLYNIVEDYGKLSASELREKSHNAVWEKAHGVDGQNMSFSEVIQYYRGNMIEAVVNEYDNEAGVFMAFSNVISGLNLEYADASKLKEEVQEIASDLVRSNFPHASS